MSLSGCIYMLMNILRVDVPSLNIWSAWPAIQCRKFWALDKEVNAYTRQIDTQVHDSLVVDIGVFSSSNAVTMDKPVFFGRSLVPSDGEGASGACR